MRFDDRLQTVLRQPADEPRDAAVRWRQLVDLIARAGAGIEGETVDRAMAAIRADSARVDNDLRAAAARAIAALPLPHRLLEYFIGEDLAVSAPILAAASIDRARWTDLRELVGDETRQFVETLHPELASAPPALATEPVVEPRELTPQPKSQKSERTTIGDVIARIERRRHHVAAAHRAGSSTKTVRSMMFRWECWPNGEISWVDGAPRGSLIGRSIARSTGESGDKIGIIATRAFARLAPFRNAELHLVGEGTAAGQWKMSGAPAFDRSDGRFAGFRGIAVRESGDIEQSPSSDLQALLDPDSLRELVHELKTPLNAIIGFAEIIDGQYLGPAAPRYRNRAGAIVGKARLLVAAIDDLDFVARTQAHAAGESESAELGQTLWQAIEKLGRSAGETGPQLSLQTMSGPIHVALESGLLERMVERLLAAAVELAVAEERLIVGIDRSDAQVRLAISRPSRLTAAGLDDIAEGGNEAESRGSSTLHLVQGLARIAGCALVLDSDALILELPAADSRAV